MRANILDFTPNHVTSCADSAELPVELQIAVTRRHPQEKTVARTAMLSPGQVSDKKPLVSEGFGDCIGLLVKDTSSGKCALFHKGGRYMLSSQYPKNDKEVLDSFLTPGSHPIGVIIKGDQSPIDSEEKMVASITSHFPQMHLNTLHLKNSAEGYWNLAYDPGRDELMIHMENNKEVRSFKNFFSQVQKNISAKYDGTKNITISTSTVSSDVLPPVPHLPTRN